VPLETVAVLLSCRHHNFRKVRTVNVSHLNITVTEKTEGRNRGEGVVVVVVDHMGLAT
jgi:hypothetical protein